MVNTKFSALPAVTVPVSTDEFPLIQSATEKKVTLALLEEYMSDKGADVASAGVTVLGDGHAFHITGTTTITDIDFTRSWDGRVARLIFDGVLTLTHNATTLILPGKQNIITGPGDSCFLVIDSGDNVKVISYERADGQELVRPGNQSTAPQTFTAAATAYAVGSAIAVPPSGLRVGSRFYWRIAGITKTNAGTATKAVLLKIGTAGAVGDATILTFTIPAGTAINTDLGYLDLFVMIRGPLGGSCVAWGHLVGQHFQAVNTTGLWNLANMQLAPAASAGFNSATANLIVGLALTMGTSEVWTVQAIHSDSENL